MFHTASHTPFVVELTCIERNEGRWVGGRSFEDDIFETINCLFHYFWKIWENELMYVPSRMAWLVGYTYKHTYICWYSIYTHIRRLRSPPIEVCSIMCCFPNFRHVVYGNTDAHTRTHTHTHTLQYFAFSTLLLEFCLLRSRSLSVNVWFCCGRIMWKLSVFFIKT